MGLWDKLWAGGYEFLGKRAQRIEGPYRERIASEAIGEVLEVGAGTGFNFPHYRVALRVVAIEPDVGMRSYAQRRASEAAVPLEVRPGNAHELDFPDDSFDTVLFSLVLCTIPDVDQALAEAKRVLRPGGEVRFYEHVRSSDPALAARQDRWLKPWRACNRGCHPNRDTLAAFERAGFTFPELEVFDLVARGIPKIVRPHAIGRAVAA
jgi:ubiquinone/menaquinone biosynthesis C-methylase UbiE